jgi:hypothetical protein
MLRHRLELPRFNRLENLVIVSCTEAGKRRCIVNADQLFCYFAVRALQQRQIRAKLVDVAAFRYSTKTSSLRDRVRFYDFSFALGMDRVRAVFRRREITIDINDLLKSWPRHLRPKHMTLLELLSRSTPTRVVSAKPHTHAVTVHVSHLQVYLLSGGIVAKALAHSAACCSPPKHWSWRFLRKKRLLHSAGRDGLLVESRHGN